MHPCYQIASMLINCAVVTRQADAVNEDAEAAQPQPLKEQTDPLPPPPEPEQPKESDEKGDSAENEEAEPAEEEEQEE